MREIDRERERRKILLLHVLLGRNKSFVVSTRTHAHTQTHTHTETCTK